MTEQAEEEGVREETTVEVEITEAAVRGRRRRNPGLSTTTKTEIERESVTFKKIEIFRVVF